jgi:hypothetical protein
LWLATWLGVGGLVLFAAASRPGDAGA